MADVNEASDSPRPSWRSALPRLGLGIGVAAASLAVRFWAPQWSSAFGHFFQAVVFLAIAAAVAAAGAEAKVRWAWIPAIICAFAGIDYLLDGIDDIGWL